MTDIIEHDDVETLSTVVPGFAIAAHTFRDMLTGALLAASKDDTLPSIATVLLEWNGGELRAVSTDRYRLVVATVVAQDSVGYTSDTNLYAPNGEGSVLLNRGEVAELVKALPKMGKRAAPESVRVSVLGDSVLMEGEGWSRTLTVMLGDFPKYRTLIPGDDNVSAIETIAVNPSFLADIAKIPSERNTPVRFRFVHENKPMLATLQGTNGVSEYLYLLMPVRVPS